jgi:hypothetical protein
MYRIGSRELLQNPAGRSSTESYASTGYSRKYPTISNPQTPVDDMDDTEVHEFYPEEAGGYT